MTRANAVPAAVSTNDETQANMNANQPISNSPNNETIDNESVVVPPPPGFN